MMGVLVVDLKALGDLAVALVELRLQPVGRLRRAIGPQLDGIDGHAVIGGVAHAIHHERLVAHIVGGGHGGAAGNTHALEHAAALAHLLEAEHLGRTVVRRGQCGAHTGDAAAGHEHVGLLRARDLVLADFAQLKGHLALTIHVRRRVDNRDVANARREHIAVHIGLEVRNARFRRGRSSGIAFSIGARRRNSTEGARSGR